MNEVQHKQAIGDGTVYDRLEELLQRQLALVRQGRLTAALELFEQTDSCVRAIAHTSDSMARGQRVERLYRELALALTTQRAEVSAALQMIRRGKRALSAYLSTVSFRR